MRSAHDRRFIAANPLICHGRLVFRGTRIPVATILELLESGMSTEDILRGYPSLTRASIRAAIHLARVRLQEGEFIPLVSKAK